MKVIVGLLDLAGLVCLIAAIATATVVLDLKFRHRREPQTLAGGIDEFLASAPRCLCPCHEHGPTACLDGRCRYGAVLCSAARRGER